MKIIKEAEQKEKREFETDVEKKLKRKILALLRDDGKGHHHAKYAKRLEDFMLKIVPRSVKPGFVAAVNWENVTIYVSDGFVVNDPDIFYQLSVLMRHELAHYILQHDIRMAQQLTQKYGDVFYQHFKQSNLLHATLNIIMDLEISNRIYKQDDDKVTVRTLHDSSRFLPGLVTDEVAKDWVKMTLPEMYNEVEKEIKNIKQSILAQWDMLDQIDDVAVKYSKIIGNQNSQHAYVNTQLVNTLYQHINYKHPTNFFGKLDEFIANKAPYHFVPYDEGRVMAICKFDSLPDFYQEIVVTINNEFTSNNNYTRQDLRDRVIEIAKTGPLDIYSLKNKQGQEIIKIYNPEEKFLAIDALKAKIPELEEYQAWYAKVQKVLSDSKYSDADRQTIFDAINN